MPTCLGSKWQQDHVRECINELMLPWKVHQQVGFVSPKDGHRNAGWCGGVGDGENRQTGKGEKVAQQRMLMRTVGEHIKIAKRKRCAALHDTGRTNH